MHNTNFPRWWITDTEEKRKRQQKRGGLSRKLKDVKISSKKKQQPNAHETENVLVYFEALFIPFPSLYVLLLNFLFSFFRYITFLSCRFCFCASTNVDMAKNSTQWWKTSHLSIFHHPYNADMMRNFSSSHFVCIPHQCSKWWDNKILTWLISIRSRQHLTKLLLLPSIMMLCVILKQ